MDALVVMQYRHVLVALAAGLLLALLTGALLARRPAVPSAPVDDPLPPGDSPRQVLPHLVLLLVALAIGTGILLLLPALMIIRYLPGRPVMALVLAALLALGAPLVYAWRARPF